MVLKVGASVLAWYAESAADGVLTADEIKELVEELAEEFGVDLAVGVPTIEELDS